MDNRFADDNWCVVCGADNPRGLHLLFSAEGGKSKAVYRAEKSHQGYRDIVHGGVLSAILDEAAIKAAASLGLIAITAEITVRFRNPVVSGEECRVLSEVTPLKGNFLKGLSRIIKPDGSIGAEAEVKLRSV